MSEKKTAAQFAAGYPVILTDGYFGPITISNIGNDNGRDIINLRVRTEKSGDNNASISFPEDWNKTEQFRPNMLVNFTIENGYVKKIYEAVAKSPTKAAKVSAAKVNQEVLDAEDDMAAQNEIDEALSGPAASTEGAVLVDEKAKDDLPF